MIKIVLSLLLLNSFSANSLADEFFDDKQKGYWWYEAKPKKEEISADDSKPKIENNKPEKPSIDKSGKEDPREFIAKQKVYLDYLLNQAVVYSSKENIEMFMAYNEEIQIQAQKFADVGKDVKWTNPNLNYSLTKPVQKEAVLAKNEKYNTDVVKLMGELSDSYGLLYFMRSDCPYCKRYSPILKQFAEKHGFTIYVVSLDKKGSHEFPYPKDDFWLAKNLNVEVVPALFLANPSDSSVVPLHYGVVSETQLVGRIVNTVAKLGEINE